MNNLTIIVDTNYLAHKCLYVAKGFDKTKYNESNKFLDNPDDMPTFINKMVTDLSYSLNTFKGYKKVICVKDDRSWRKKVNIPNHNMYKSARTQSDDINWSIFHKSIDEFLNIVSDNGVIVSSIDSAEGDDLIYLWVDYILNKETPDSVLVFSGDGDLSQIVDFNDDVFSVVYDTKQKNNSFIAKKGFIDWLRNKEETTIDIFNTGIDRLFNKNSVDLIKDILYKYDKFNIDINEVDPNEIVLNKIICGDSGDGVPSIWEWGKIKENGRYEKRITPRHYKKVHTDIINTFGEIDISQLQNNNKFKNRVRLILQESANINIPLEEFKEKLDVNTTLIYLNKDVIPKDIVDEFNENKESLYRKFKNKVLDKNILKDTPYYKVKEKIDDSIFNY